MTDRPFNALPDRQRGVVLVMALVLLVAIALLSIAGLSTTTLEFRMAAHQQARVDSFQQAESGIDGVRSDLGNFPVSGLVGVGRCTPDFMNANKYYDASGEVQCSSFDVSVPTGFDLSHTRVATTRLAPLLQPAPRHVETSVEKLKVATFKIDSRHDARNTRGARAEHNQGLLVTVLTPTEETVVRSSDFDLN